MTWKKCILFLAAAGIGAGAAATTEAADHTEATSVGVGDPASNIADYYAWHTEGGNIVAVLTVDGAKAPVADQSGNYDADVLYAMHFDTDADQMPDETILVRFGQNAAGAWGVQAEGIPGAVVLSGGVETNLDDGAGAELFAGLRDDPFFFDLDGFNMTTGTGTLSFDATRDSIAGANATALVVSFPASALGSTSFDTWAATARIGE